MADLSRRAALSLALGAAAAPLLARPALAQVRAPEADRLAILAMAGNYRVRFDFRETVSFRAGYSPLEPKTSGGDEIIRLVEDNPGFISLQHILVMAVGGQTIVTKHWRQDWTWQPAELLTYAALDNWVLRPVPAAERAGQWSQTVWQTDDSPRYGGLGRWDHDAGVSRWTSDVSLRPLARRDAVRQGRPFNRYRGINRHALTPTGWIHEQDNAKLGEVEGAAATFVHETVLNTYTRTDGFDPAAGDRYWSATGEFWAAVRAMWDARIRASGGLRLPEEANMGSVSSPQLMGLADEVEAGRLTTADAVRRAQATIVATSGPPVRRT